MPFRIEDARWVDDETAAAIVEGWWVPAAGVAGAPPSLVTPSGRIAAQTVRRPDVNAAFGLPPEAEPGFVFALERIDPEEWIELRDGADNVLGRWPGSWIARRGPNLRGYRHRTPAFDAPTQPVSFDVVTPVWNTPAKLLRACLRSVQAQTWPHWRHLLLDDGSDDPATRAVLHEARACPRTAVVSLPRTGNIAAATNRALALLQADFAAFLDHDDTLDPCALAALARAACDDPSAAVLHSDEDKIDASDRTARPFFKPDFAPTYLLGVMYPGHLLAVRTEQLRAVGGCDPRYHGIQDYELFLRLVRAGCRVRHVPHVLYHWRVHAGSSSMVGNVKGDIDGLFARCVDEHLDSLGVPLQAQALGHHRVRLRAKPEAPSMPWQRIALEDIMAGREPPRDRAAQALAIESTALSADADGIATLSELLHAPWIGIVAPLWLRDHQTVAGAGLAIGHCAPWVRRRLEYVYVRHDGYFGTLAVAHEVAAVEPWRFLVRRSLWDRLGGFAPAFRHNALMAMIDLCLRAKEAGYVTVVAPWVHGLLPAPHLQLQLGHAGADALRILQHREPSHVDPFYPRACDPTAGDYRLPRLSGARRSATD